MSATISGSEYPLKKIFSSDFDYVIPPYQRPYAWGEEQVSELFDDLHNSFCNDREGTYFLGSIVLIKKEGAPHSTVIDGQQRLTTLTILFASIASLLPKDLQLDFKKYVEQAGDKFEGLDPKPRLALREKDKKFFADSVQSLNFDELLAPGSARLEIESQKNIQKNSRLLLERLKDTFSNDSEKLCDFGKFLVNNCYLVVVSTPNKDSAYKVFSVLNNRGLELMPTDIIKADVIGELSDSQLIEFAKRWEELENHTKRDGFNNLFAHIRMIYAKEKPKRAIYIEFTEYVLKEVGAENLMENVLEPYAASYIIAKSKQYRSDNEETNKKINSLLTWLNRIDNSDWLPPAILFLKQGNEPDYVLWFFSKLERLAAYLHICAKNVNRRITRYAKVISSLEKPHSMDSPALSVDLSDDEIDEMKKALDGNIYDDLTTLRCHYLITRLDSFLSDGGPPMIQIN